MNWRKNPHFRIQADLLVSDCSHPGCKLTRLTKTKKYYGCSKKSVPQNKRKIQEKQLGDRKLEKKL